MNKVILLGRLTKDPEVRYSNGQNSIAIARYTLAVDRRGRRDQNNGEPTADFIPCVAFDRGGEFAERYFHKGMRVMVEGRWQSGSYTNRDGQKVYTHECVVTNQEFADGKSDGAGGRADNAGWQRGGGDYQSAPAQDRRNEEPVYEQENFMNIPDNLDDEGLPFN